jgi:hypothetical protein
MSVPSDNQTGIGVNATTSAKLPQGLRFYPPEIANFASEPSLLDFAIRPTGDACGEGLVALRDFAVNEIVFVFNGTIVSEITQYTLQLGFNQHIHDPHVMGKVLHHCMPNCRVELERLAFIAIRPIAAGDFVTMDYCQTEDTLFKSFTCHCGAPDCRGVIQGRLYSVAIPSLAVK